MIYVIIGPTGSGKTDVANEIALFFNCPLINADAFQIYKEMDIGTNKISKNDKLYNSYHLIDFINPDTNYSVKQYQEDGRKVLKNLVKENENIIIVGGTGLYIKALLYDYEFKDENTEIDNDLLELNNEDLHKILEKLDPKESEKIHVNNRKRMLRAITLIRHSDSNKTDLIAKQTHSLIYGEQNVLFLCLNPDREELYEKINNRVNKMFELGLVDEVKNISKKYDLSITASQGIGYKEVIEYLDNKINLEDCIKLIQQRTRNYAKRQITFFKHQFKNVKYFSSKEEMVKFIKNN